MCDFDTAGEENEQKQSEYMSALYGIALHEIFYRETLLKPLIALREEFETVRQCLENCSQDFAQVLDTTEDMSWKLKESSVYLRLMTEQNNNLAVEFQLIMLFDSLNVYGKTGRFLNDWLGDLRKETLIGFFKDNPNRRKVYQQVDSYVEKVFLSYWKEVPQEEQLDFPWAICNYFGQLEIARQEPERGDQDKMRRAKAILVQAWRTNGGED